MEVPYDPRLPEYFSNHRDFIESRLSKDCDNSKGGLFEKTQIRWVKAWGPEMSEMAFRPWYKNLVVDHLFSHRREIDNALSD